MWHWLPAEHWHALFYPLVKKGRRRSCVCVYDGPHTASVSRGKERVRTDTRTHTHAAHWNGRNLGSTESTNLLSLDAVALPAFQAITLLCLYYQDFVYATHLLFSLLLYWKPIEKLSLFLTIWKALTTRSPGARESLRVEGGTTITNRKPLVCLVSITQANRFSLDSLIRRIFLVCLFVSMP